MSNELLWLIFLGVDLAAVVVVHRLFGRAGLYALIAMSVVLCNVQVLKLVDLFGLTTSLGNVLYASIFLATDILNERHGPREARRAVLLGFVVMVVSTLTMSFAIWFQPSAADEVHLHLRVIFGVIPAVTLSSLVAYLLSQLVDVTLFARLRRATSGRHLWLRNNASTLLSQLLDTAVFTGLMVAFEIFPRSHALEIFATAYVLKGVVALLDTPFLYLACGPLAPRESGIEGEPLV